MRPRRFDGKEEIVAAAARLFARRGYKNTTITDIVQHLGIARPTLYQYVDGKGSLLERVVDGVEQKLRAGSEEALAESDDPGERLRALIRNFVRVIADSTTVFRILFGEEKELPPRLRRRFDHHQRKMASIYEDAIETCRAEGLVRNDVDPKVASFLLIGMLASVARWYEPRGEVTPDELADQVLAILRIGT